MPIFYEKRYLTIYKFTNLHGGTKSIKQKG